MPMKKEYVENFRDLIAYKKALIFRKEMYTRINSTPSSEEFLIDSMRKASCAIIANLAEGNVNYYYEREYQHYDIAQCKLAKCRSLLDLVYLKGYVKEEKYSKLQESSHEITRIIHALMKRSERFLTDAVESNNDYTIKNKNYPNLEATIERVKEYQKVINNMVRTLPDEEKNCVCDQLHRAVKFI